MSAWRILRIVYILPIIVNRNTIRISQMNQQPTMKAYGYHKKVQHVKIMGTFSVIDMSMIGR